MRIIAGTYRSRAVKAGKGQHIRPTSDKVKGALFNMLEPVAGLRVLDLYAGTGNLGLEALSRGASFVEFVDKHPGSVRLIRENLASLGIAASDPRLVIRCADVLSACRDLMNAGEGFDVILADPPYEPGAAKRVQEILALYPLLAPEGVFCVEHDTKDEGLMPDFHWVLVRRRVYGDSTLTLFKRDAV